MHEKGFQDQLDVCTLISNQARRAVVVQQINWLPNYCYVVLSFFCFVLSKTRAYHFVVYRFWIFRAVMFSVARSICGPPRLHGLPSCTAPPRPALLSCYALFRFKRLASQDFEIRKIRRSIFLARKKQSYLFVLVFRVLYVNYTCRVQNSNISQAGRVRAHSKVAGRGRS